MKRIIDISREKVIILIILRPKIDTAHASVNLQISDRDSRSDSIIYLI